MNTLLPGFIARKIELIYKCNFGALFGSCLSLLWPGLNAHDWHVAGSRHSKIDDYIARQDGRLAILGLVFYNQSNFYRL